MGKAIAIVSGVVLLIGAVAGFVILPEHKPIPAGTSVRFGGGWTITTDHGTGLSQTLYDALRITTWALLIIGVVLIVVGLIKLARRHVPST